MTLRPIFGRLKGHRYRWMNLSAMELRVVITTMASIEHRLHLGPLQNRTRRVRLAAVTFYRQKFGDANNLSAYAHREAPRRIGQRVPGIGSHSGP